MKLYYLLCSSSFIVAMFFYLIKLSLQNLNKKQFCLNFKLKLSKYLLHIKNKQLKYLSFFQIQYMEVKLILMRV